MTTKKSFLLGIFLCLFAAIQAQTDTLKVLNVIVQKEIKNKPLQLSDTTATTNDTLFYKTVFTISNVQQLSEVYIKVGDEQNQGNNEDMSFTKQIVNNKAQLLSADNVVYKIWGNRGYYTFYMLRSEVTGQKWLTIYFKDINGVYSTKQYFNF